MMNMGAVLGGRAIVEGALSRGCGRQVITAGNRQAASCPLVARG